MASLTGGVPTAGPHHSPPISPPRSSSLYPPAYGPTGNGNGSVQYGNTNPGSYTHPDHPGPSSTTQVSTHPPLNAAEEAASKPKPKRRKAAPDDAKTESDNKPKRQRKPKDPNAPPPKKRVKKEDKQAADPKPLGISPMYPPSTGATSTPVVAASNAITLREHSNIISPQSGSFAPPSRPVSSGQRYDPVRGEHVDIPTTRPSSSSAYGPVSLKSPVRSSPSIANLIDRSPSSTHAPSPAPHQRTSSSTVYSPVPNGMSSSTNTKPSAPSALRLSDSLGPNDSLSSTKHMDSPQRKPSPKGAKANGNRELQPPPLPGGSLPPQPLTNGDLGKPANRERKYEDVPNDCIVIDVPIKKDESGGNNYVNFLKEVENKYGFDVAYPRIAEHRKRMKEMAAAGAALESIPGSADEMNLDVSEGESDVEMGGQGDGSNSEGARRKRKTNEKYDLDDEFIDDSEMIWQDQALASRDGYFVWSGPLIQEGDKPTIERADGTVKRGGRGGGRGSRGGATRGDGTRTRGSRGGGPGSRGGTTVRKPRVTKADRQRMENEKAEREKMAASTTKPVLYPGTVTGNA